MRKQITKNHSAVHILQKTLQDLLGNTVHQAGSKVDQNTFRFDFTYRGKLSDKLIIDIERKANEKLSTAIKTKIEYMPLEDAKQKGAMALFEDKYDDIVRVVSIGDSIELCGGTHVKNIKDIGKIAILKIENKGSDTYRIEGTTDNSIESELKKVTKPYTDEITKLLEKSKKLVMQAKEENVKCCFDFDIEFQVLDSYADVVYYKEQLERLKISIKKLEKNVNEEITHKSLENIEDFLKLKENINDITTIITTTSNLDVPMLKQLVDNITNQEKNCFVLIANLNKNNINIICKTNINSSNIHCGNIVKEICQKCSGNGGGNQFYAQGGGSDAKNIITYLKELKEKIKNI